MTKTHKEYCALGISMIVIAFITGFPLFARGIGGDIWDATYHLLRIEAVKEALLNGDFPPRVNPNFFNGYGYGSSLFYPDVFLVIPAVMNLCGISILLSYKLFILMITMAGTCSTYFSVKFICRDWKWALTGSYVLMLSTFYLADVNNRAGISEYLACVFVPILMAGIYDYFTGGMRTYLIGIAFLGMALSHTIMTYIGLLITIVIFVVMLFIPEKRKLVFGSKGHMKRLLLIAVLTVLSASYYIFPMLEQLLNERFRFHEPWAQIGDYTQSIRSFFKPVGVFLNTADFGVGIPVLLLLAGRIFMGKLKNKWADFYLISGGFLLLATSSVIPWKYLQNTQLNMIQFTYRFYPYVLFFLICGMSVAYAEKNKRGRAQRCFILFIVATSIVCGVWENLYCYHFGTRVAVNTEYLRENSHWVGAGEWLPEGVSDVVADGQGINMVTAEASELQWTASGYNSYAFSVDAGSGKTYIVPLIYYKGYRAEFISSNGEKQELAVSKSADGLVRIESPRELQGMIEVRYAGTAVQKISNVISCIVILSIGLTFIYNKIKRAKMNKLRVDTDGSLMI